MQTGTNTQTVFNFTVGPASTTTYQLASGTDAIGCTISGSGSATAAVVPDTTSPVINCAAVPAQSANADANCQATVPDVRGLVRAQSSDNCTATNSLIVTQSPTQGTTVSGTGSHPITVTVTDASNNSTSCIVAFTGIDNTPPTITCGGNITKPTDPNLCTAVVTFPAPTVSDNCSVGAPTCSPASGTAFQKGTTTVTCTVKDGSNNMSSCSFTVTVNDTQPPSITCPGNITSVAAASCPIQTSTPPVNFTVTASDNCPGVTVVCKNQSGAVVASGQTFPIGTTAVTCTATDTSGNTATCGFTVSGFSFCLQDETNPGNFVLINASTGDYSFFCNGVLIASGRGTLNAKGCEGTIEHNKGDRRVLIVWDTTANGGKGAGTAIVQVGVNNTRCQITDKDMQNNTCTAPAPVMAPGTGKPKKGRIQN
jgi:hypothetical protein